MALPDKTINGVSVKAILEDFDDDPDGVQRIAERKGKAPEVTIVEPNPEWLEQFQLFSSRITAAFEARDASDEVQQQKESDEASRITILAINHVGSTSVPGLPAKAVIDIDLVLSENSLSSERFYVPCLEEAGFQFLLREPDWHGHRFFYTDKPMPCNLHVWGPRCPEVERHRIFRNWLLEHCDDRDLYARTKRECADLSKGKGEAVAEYNLRKQGVIREILARAFETLQ